MTGARCEVALRVLQKERDFLTRQVEDAITEVRRKKSDVEAAERYHSKLAAELFAIDKVILTWSEE